MKSLILPPNEFLDHYVLNVEFSHFANISKNAYKFWKKAEIGRYQGTRIVFLHKNCILEKHQNALKQCTDLSGFVLASAFFALLRHFPPLIWLRKIIPLFINFWSLKSFLGLNL